MGVHGLALAIFDLDNTLLAGDSDYLWGQFLIARGIVDGVEYERENQRFYDEYKAGTLDIFEFLRFSLQPLSRFEMTRLNELHNEFMQQVITPIMLPGGKELIEKHRSQGDQLLIITATNSFITSPIVKALGIHELLATEPEVVNNRYTGNVTGQPCYRQGKVTRLNSWLEDSGHTLQDSWFYSDSHNDLPLLEIVDNPVAVDPDDALRHHARQHHWQIISLRDDKAGK